MQKQLSILIPTRNRAKYLIHAIQSALNVRGQDIEILVSENYGSDNGLEVANSFHDPRLKVFQPGKPLPMHENWEFLLQKSSGRWITFIGDDDAVMPHCCEYLTYIEKCYPNAEAIVSPRAYYFWEHAYFPNEIPKCYVAFSHLEVWRDSKKQLHKCLNNQLTYLSLPQMYSGGFQSRSLVERVIRLQNGQYFRSVTPDAYSALMGVLHTYRYLEVGVPLTWVGTSAQSSYDGQIQSSKDRFADFYGMHSIKSLSINTCLGNKYNSWTFLLHFYESYLSAAPFTSPLDLSLQNIKKVYSKSALELIANGRIRESGILAESLGVSPLNSFVCLVRSKCNTFSSRIAKKAKQLFKILLVVYAYLGYKITRNASYWHAFQRLNYNSKYSANGTDCAHILSSDAALARIYLDYRCHCIEKQAK